MKLKGAFDGCKWCQGNGCMACDEERARAEELRRKPIFTASLDDPEDMKAMKEIFHADALTAAFSEGGGGMREIEEKAAIASLLQALRKNSGNQQPSEENGQ